jgi:phospholipid N-methyltransferase
MDKSIYIRPNKPSTITVRRRRAEVPSFAPLEVPQVIAVDRATECHVTPASVAARMVDYLEAGNSLTLEPEAGTGNLMQALLEAGHSPGNLVAIERHVSLFKVLKTRFVGSGSVTLMNRCFLDYAKEVAGKVEYPRILMNPPFSQVRAHMGAALSLIGPGSVLVALVPITYEHDDAQTMEVLGRNTFANAQVMTKIVRFEG